MSKFVQLPSGGYLNRDMVECVTQNKQHPHMASAHTSDGSYDVFLHDFQDENRGHVIPNTTEIADALAVCVEGEGDDCETTVLCRKIVGWRIETEYDEQPGVGMPVLALDSDGCWVPYTDTDSNDGILTRRLVLRGGDTLYNYYDGTAEDHSLSEFVKSVEDLHKILVANIRAREEIEARKKMEPAEKAPNAAPTH